MTAYNTSSVCPQFFSLEVGDAGFCISPLDLLSEALSLCFKFISIQDTECSFSRMDGSEALLRLVPCPAQAEQSWASLVTLNESNFCFLGVLTWKALSTVSWKGGADPSEKLAILKNKSESCEHLRYEKTQAVTYSWSRWCAAQCLRCLNHLIRVFHLQLCTLPVTWSSVRFHRSCCGSGLPHSSCAVLILLFSRRCTCKPWHCCCLVFPGSDSCWWESHPFSPLLSCTLFSSF